MYHYHLVRVILPTGKPTTVSLHPVLAIQGCRHFGGPRQLNRFVRNELAAFDGNGYRSKFAARAIERALESKGGAQ